MLTIRQTGSGFECPGQIDQFVQTPKDRIDQTTGVNTAMRIGILGGTGRMGRGLAHSYVHAGHEVILGSRSPNRAQNAAKEIGPGVRGASLQKAAQEGEIVVLAVGFSDAAATVLAVENVLVGKILIDITNPFGAVPPGTTSGIEKNGQSAPAARWVAAYKTNFWQTIDPSANVGQDKRDVLVCSDDNEAKRRVMQLIDETGLRAVDCGELINARTLDLMVPLMLELDHRYGSDALSSWKFITPETG